MFDPLRKKILYFAISAVFAIVLVCGCKEENKVVTLAGFKGTLKGTDAPMKNYVMPSSIVNIRNRVADNYPPVTIFAVPQKNSIGTFDLDNELSILEFEGENITRRSIMKYDPNHFPYSSSEKFGSVPINSSEVYRWAMKELALFNMDKIEDIGYSSDLSNDYVNAVAFDKEKYLFLCEMDAGVTNLRMIQFNLPIGYTGDKIDGSKGKYRIIAEKKFEDDNIIGATDFWIHDKTIFAFHTKKLEMYAYDSLLHQVQHPLATLLNQKKFRIFDLAIHPTLPFAIVGYDTSSSVKIPSAFFYAIVRWEFPKEKERIQSLPPAGMIIPANPLKQFLSDYQFSPDGKWLLVKDGTKSYDNPDLYVFPVQPDNPIYLGSPLYLGNATRNGAIKQESACWIVDPCSYVVCDGMLLYKWNMPETKKP